MENVVEKLCQGLKILIIEDNWRDIAYCLSLLSSRSWLKEWHIHYQDKLNGSDVYNCFTAKVIFSYLVYLSTKLTNYNMDLMVKPQRPAWNETLWNERRIWDKNWRTLETKSRIRSDIKKNAFVAPHKLIQKKKILEKKHYLTKKTNIRLFNNGITYF